MVEILSLETPGGKLIDAVAYSDYATLQPQQIPSVHVITPNRREGEPFAALSQMRAAA